MDSSSFNRATVQHEVEFCARRFEKGIQQNIYVVDVDTDKQNDKTNPHILFFVCGTTQNTYEVVFGKNNVHCSCMDFQIHKHLCKHLYFLIGKVGKLNLQQIQNMFGYGEPVLKKTSFFSRKEKGFKIISNKIVEIIEKNVEKMKRGDGENCCCICLETLEKKDRCIECEKCKNLFHSACIRFWLNKRNKCPLCRFSFTIQ